MSHTSALPSSSFCRPVAWTHHYISFTGHRPGVGTNWTHEVSSLPIPTTRETVGVVTVRDCYVSSVFTSHKSQAIKPLCDRAYGFSPLSQKTRMSNHWQMQSKGCASLLVPLGHFKLLNANSAGMWTRANRSELWYSNNWTKRLQSAVLNGFGTPRFDSTFTRMM